MVSAPLTDAPGTLYVVSTPIGNLGDLSPRAVDTLRAVAAILAEDTRHSRVLCDRFEIRTPLIAYHEHNEAQAAPGFVARMVAGESLALISDAGTPLVSDPGARLVRAAIDAGVPVSPVPGPSALLAALVGSGLVADQFTFLGFLPRKGGERAERLDQIRQARHAMVLYEAPPRVARTLAELSGLGAGDRQTVVARELTKQYEEFRRGTVSELAAYYGEHEPRGEVVIVIEGAAATPPDEAALRTQAAAWRAEGLAARDIQRRLQGAGAPRNLAYRLAHES